MFRSFAAFSFNTCFFFFFFWTLNAIRSLIAYENTITTTVQSNDVEYCVQYRFRLAVLLNIESTEKNADVLNAKRNAHNFRFDFCRTLLCRSKLFIPGNILTFTNKHTECPSTSNCIERVISIYRKTMKIAVRVIFSVKSIPDYFLNEAPMCQHSKSASLYKYWPIYHISTSSESIHLSNIRTLEGLLPFHNY